MSRRTQRVSSELRGAIQKVIAKGLSDPRIRGLVTITNVRITDDLQQARVGVSVYPEQKEALTLHGLQSAARHIRREAAEIMALAKMPELIFESDASIRRQSEVLGALAKVREDLETKGADEGPAEDGAREEDGAS